MFPFPRLSSHGGSTPPDPPLNDEYIGIASSTNSKIVARNGDIFTDLGSVSVVSAWQTAWHPTSPIVAIALNASPWLLVYNLTTGAPVSVSLGAAAPTQAVRSVRWSPDGQYLALGYPATPWMQILRFLGGTFTKLTNPATLPGNEPRGIAWSADSTRVVYNKTASGAPAYRIFSVSGTTVTFVSTVLVGAFTFTIDIARDMGETIVGGDGATPYAVGMSWGSGKNSITASGVNPPRADSTAVTSVAWNKDGTLIAVVSSAGCAISSWNGSAYTLLDTVTATGMTEAGWTGNDICIIGRSSSPWAYMRKVVGGVVSSPTVDAGVFNGNVRSPKGSLVP